MFGNKRKKRVSEWRGERLESVVIIVRGESQTTNKLIKYKKNK